MTKKTMTTAILINEIERSQTIAVSGHVHPDGDCVGSALAVKNFIAERWPSKCVDVYLEEIPNIFKFMKYSEEILHEVSDEKTYDLFIAVDCGGADRLGFSRPLFERTERTLCIDHHISLSEFANVSHIDPEASSACELVFDLLGEENISKSTAECLYTGMVTDSGLFRYPATHPSTMRAAAALMEKGINHTDIIFRTFDEKSFAQQKVFGKCLTDSRLYLNGTVIASYLTAKDMEEFQVKPKHLDGIVSQMRNTQGVDVAIFLYPVADGAYKISLRSTEKVDVAAICRVFGGGGHMRAAGVTMQGEPEALIQTIINQIILSLGEV